MSEIPSIALNNGLAIPQLGLGVWQTKDGDEVVKAIHAAIDNGYRLIDTAKLYGNEKGVGEAIRTASIPREELFVTTKLWNNDHGYDYALKAFDESLERLGLDYIDMYLIHWPVPALDKYVETWQALEEIYASGRAKAIGVCNFNPEHLDRLLASAKIIPAVNQIELHPRLQQEQLRQYCADKGIHVESWSPIGGTGGNLLQDSTLLNIATKYGKSPAQIVLRWHIQLGLIVIPKSVHAERIAQNIDIFDFQLDDEDMTVIKNLNTNSRRGPDPATMNNHMNNTVIKLATTLGLDKHPKQ